MKFIDKFLNNITMYRLVLYYLIVILAVAIIFSFIGILPFSPFNIIADTFFLVAISFIANIIFARVFKAAANTESVYITALILALIISPLHPFQNISFLIWAAVLATASKYIIALHNKHLFNPAALAVVLTSFALNQSANWWVSAPALLPIVLIGGMLIVRKIKRFDMVLGFFLTVLVTIMGFGIFKGIDILSTAQRILITSPLLFFAFVMLTEPLTTPPTKRGRWYYGVIVGFLYVPQTHLGSFYFTPELALIIGNIYAYLVSPKEKLLLRLRYIKQLAPDIYDFVFNTNREFSFLPGQYLEWTLAHQNPDNRGNRRYFTIASSPTEKDIRIGVKFYDRSSSFKKSLKLMRKDSEIFAGQLAGDFTLPKNPNQKLVFIAGGIGITPYRSMLKYLLSVHQPRPIILLYSNKNAKDIVYYDTFSQAQNELGIKTVYTVTDNVDIPSDWPGRTGFIDKAMILAEIPDYLDRIFYISGPPSMVAALENVLKEMGVKSNQIRTDYFPGFA